MAKKIEDQRVKLDYNDSMWRRLEQAVMAPNRAGVDGKRLKSIEFEKPVFGEGIVVIFKFKQI